MKKGGFTVIEALTVIAIIAILALISMPVWSKFYRAYKFNEYAYTIEALIRWAKITAIERSIHTEICLENNNGLPAIVVKDAGTSRGCRCEGTVISRVSIEDSWVTVSVNGSFGKECVNFDPRGLAVLGGTVCIRSDDGREYAIVLQSSRGAIVIRGFCG